MSDTSLMTQVGDLARQIGEFAAANAQPAAELAGRVAQARAVGVMAGVVLGALAIAAVFVASWRFAKAGIAYTPKKDSDEGRAARYLGACIAAVVGSSGLVALVVNAPWWMVAAVSAGDWRIALAARVLGAL